MKAAAIQPQDISAEKVLNIGQTLAWTDLIAESLRSEMAARRVCSRRILCKKVVALLEPLQLVSDDEVKDILSQLENNGDVTVGVQGQIAAAPLRAVDLGNGRYRLHGCATTRKLILTFQKDMLSLGVNRFLSGTEDQKKFANEITSLGGIVLLPERWSGLTRSPRADEHWLFSLDPILEDRKISAGGLDDGINDGWQTYKPDVTGIPQNERWKKAEQEDDGKLWRGWHERGWYVFAWTFGKSPSLSSYIKLSSDHARRTMFALDRKNDNPVPFSATKDGDRVFLSIAGFLPVAEYRYFATIGNFIGRKGGYYCFDLPSESWLKTGQIMDDRLGLKIGKDE